MKVYFESSALFKAYWPEKGSGNVEWVLGLLGKEEGVTSRWVILEIPRGFLKRRNLGEIGGDEAEDSINFFLHDINRLEVEEKMQLVDVTRAIIREGLVIMREYNLYAADSLHCATAIKAKADVVLVDDRHYEKLHLVSTLKFLDITTEAEKFKRAFRELLA